MKNLITTLMFFLIASFAIAQGSLDSGIVAHYSFNGDANDLSGNGNHGTVYEALLTSDRFGNSNSAYQFDGASDYIAVPDNATLDLTNEITLCAWVKRTRFGVDMIFEKGGDWTAGTCNYGMSLHNSNNNMFYFFFNGGWRGTDGVNDFNWHHYAVVAQHGNANPLLYIDGELKTVYYSDGAATINLTSSTLNLNIGSQLGSFIYYGANVIDEIRIYNRVLTQDEILMLAGNGLIGFYPFNGNANDESGHGYNGSVSGATLTNDRFNQADKAYNFVYNGFSSDRIQVAGTSNLNFSTGGFSISAWIKFTGIAGSGNNYPIVSKHICGEQSGYILMLYNGKLTFWLAGASGYNILSTNEDYTDEIWHQVVAVYDGTSKFIYVDGVLKNSITFNYSVTNSADWALGGYNGCNGGFNGKVDEIKIYNRPLSAAEVLEDYNLTRNSLVAYLPFNGSTIDISGNGHDGAINGNAALVPDRFNTPDRAFTFPNQSSNISLANSTNMNLENGFTLNAWIKYKNTYSAIIGKHICGYVNGFVLAIDYDGQIQLLLGNSSWASVRTNSTFIENQWYMVTATFDGT
nr:LamG domain-containing protein [Ignavibacterium sp.]